MKEPRQCDYCKTVYTPKRVDSQFCSPQCKGGARWSRKLETRSVTKSYRQATTLRLQPLSDVQRQLVLGSILGDGSLGKNTGGCYLRFCHGDPQLEYLLWKQSILGPLAPAPHRSYQKLFLGKMNTQHHIHTITHPEFTELRALVYRDGEKHVSHELLSGIDALGFAVWYMDDGSFLKAANSRQVVFCTEAFAPDEVVLLQRWFDDRWGVRAVLQPQTTNAGERFRLRINRTQTSTFFNIVEPFIHPALRYKLPNQEVFPAD